MQLKPNNNHNDILKKITYIKQRTKNFQQFPFINSNNNSNLIKKTKTNILTIINKISNLSQQQQHNQNNSIQKYFPYIQTIYRLLSPMIQNYNFEQQFYQVKNVNLYPVFGIVAFRKEMLMNSNGLSNNNIKDNKKQLNYTYSSVIDWKLCTWVESGGVRCVTVKQRSVNDNNNNNTNNTNNNNNNNQNQQKQINKLKQQLKNIHGLIIPQYYLSQSQVFIDKLINTIKQIYNNDQFHILTIGNSAEYFLFKQLQTKNKKLQLKQLRQPIQSEQQQPSAHQEQENNNSNINKNVNNNNNKIRMKQQLFSMNSVNMCGKVLGQYESQIFYDVQLGVRLIVQNQNMLSLTRNINMNMNMNMNMNKKTNHLPQILSQLQQYPELKPHLYFYTSYQSPTDRPLTVFLSQSSSSLRIYYNFLNSHQLKHPSTIKFCHKIILNFVQLTKGKYRKVQQPKKYVGHYRVEFKDGQERAYYEVG